MTGGRVRTAGAAAALVACLAGWAAGCGSEPERDASRRAPDEAPAPPSPAGTAALYRTTVAFAAPDTTLALLLRFRQTSSAETLTRRYRGWIGGAGTWEPLLALDDTLPVGRARWRVLPGGPLRLEAAPGGEITVYRLRRPGGAAVLELGDQLASWPSATGQRERLRRARMRLGGDTVPGVAVVRRSAHALPEEPADAEGPFLLLALEDGNGLVVVVPAEGPAAAHGGLEEGAATWDSVALELPTAGAPGRLRSGDGGLSIVLAPLAGDEDDPARSVSGVAGDPARRPVRGLLVPGEDR